MDFQRNFETFARYEKMFLANSVSLAPINGTTAWILNRMQIEQRSIIPDKTFLCIRSSSLSYKLKE